jgi:hypothetical protein
MKRRQRDALDYFRFDAVAWLTSPVVSCMTPAQEGAFIRLLAYQAKTKDCSLPDSDTELATLSRLGEAWKTDGVFVRAQFEPDEERTGRIFNKKLRAEWKAAWLGYKSRKKRNLRYRSGDGKKTPQRRLKSVSPHIGEGTGAVAGTVSEDNVTDTDNQAGMPPDPITAWRAKDDRTIPQLAEAAIAFSMGMPDLTAAETATRWMQDHAAPQELHQAITRSIERARALGSGYDDFGPAGDHERLIAKGEPIVGRISTREGLDQREVVAEASMHNGHSYLSLREIPANRHRRLIRTVMALDKWDRRISGKTQPSAKDGSGRKSVGERTADTVRRMIARRTDAAEQGPETGGEIHGGAGEAGRRLPAGDGRRDG